VAPSPLLNDLASPIQCRQRTHALPTRVRSGRAIAGSRLPPQAPPAVWHVPNRTPSSLPGPAPIKMAARNAHAPPFLLFIFYVLHEHHLPPSLPFCFLSEANRRRYASANGIGNAAATFTPLW
jgi:hypothetical protein